MSTALNAKRNDKTYVSGQRHRPKQIDQHQVEHTAGPAMNHRQSREDCTGECKIANNSKNEDKNT